MNPLSSLSFLSSPSVALLPFGLLLIFVLLMVPSLLASSTPRPEAIAKAILCYIMKGLALGLLAISLTPVLYALLAGSLLPQQSLSALAVLFVIGLGIFVHFNRVAHTIDEVSIAVPRAIFHHTYEALGAVVSVIAGLSILVTFLLTERTDAWQFPATMLILGLLLMTSFSLHDGPRKTMKVKAINGKKK